MVDSVYHRWEMTSTAPDTVAAVEDLVGVTDIAQRLGVAVNTAWRWSKGERGKDFPEPAGRIGGRPVWKWRDVEKWAAQRSKR